MWAADSPLSPGTERRDDPPYRQAVINGPLEIANPDQPWSNHLPIVSPVLLGDKDILHARISRTESIVTIQHMLRTTRTHYDIISTDGRRFLTLPLPVR
ncbi:hypothetical protein DTO212C5_4056 [Paecilomyces variotii]|nr:hypothetical protein DTO212C5_4056 [Paecilomyces variotii]